MERLEKPTSLEEQAYLHIKDAILKGTLAPGEFLAETRLTEDLGVSKTPIRNAMARLHQEGFLVSIPYKGHFVAKVSAADIIEIYELRQLLECYIIRRTVPEFTPSELQEMRLALEASEEALERGDIIKYVTLNRNFHHFYDRKYGHQRISDVLLNLDEHVQRIILHALHHEYGDLLGKQRTDHRLILEATQNKDADLAVWLMKKHLSEFCDSLVERMVDQG